MRTNYKKLQYSWENDPKVKEWKVAFDARPASPTVFQTRVKVDGKWVFQTGEGQPTVECPPDPRTKEQIKNDLFIDRVKVWDRREQKSHVYSIKLLKNELRRQLRTVHQLKKGTYKQGLIKMDLERALNQVKLTEYLDNPSEQIHLWEYVDYVNERFGLNIRKDVLTDNEFELSKIIFAEPVKKLEGV